MSLAVPIVSPSLSKGEDVAVLHRGHSQKTCLCLRKVMSQGYSVCRYEEGAVLADEGVCRPALRYQPIQSP